MRPELRSGGELNAFRALPRYPWARYQTHNRSLRVLVTHAGVHLPSPPNEAPAAPPKQKRQQVLFCLSCLFCPACPVLSRPVLSCPARHEGNPDTKHWSSRLTPINTPHKCMLGSPGHLTPIQGSGGVNPSWVHRRLCPRFWAGFFLSCGTSPLKDGTPPPFLCGPQLPNTGSSSLNEILCEIVISVSSYITGGWLAPSLGAAVVLLEHSRFYVHNKRPTGNTENWLHPET